MNKNSEFTYTVTSSVPNTTFYWELGKEQLYGQKVIIDWTEYGIGTYTLTVFGIANGCRSLTLRYTIIVTECSTIYIPSAFTPNGDGLNDTWFPIGDGWEEIEVLIFNRWGELIFESHNPKGFWDGTYLGKPIIVQNDIYVYKVTWKGFGNPLQAFYGNLTIVN